MANKFWVGGNGNWSDATNHWATSSGGAAGAGNLPTTSDVAKFDAASTGTCTLDQDITISGLDISAANAAGCGLDASGGSHNVTITSISGLAASGSGTRVLKLGGGQWSVTAGNGNTWNFSTTTGLTFAANTSSILIVADATSGHTMTFAGGGLTYNNLTINGNANGDEVFMSGNNTFNVLTINAPMGFGFQGTTQTITTLTMSGGSSAALTSLFGTSPSVNASLVLTNNCSASWATFRAMAISGTGTISATNSFDLGANSGFGMIVQPGGSHFVGG